MRLSFLLFLSCATLAVANEAEENLIDRHVFAKMQRDGIPAAPLSPDAEFLRRLTLDLTGRLPEPEAARRFLADSAPGKRERLIRSLIPPLPVTSMRSISTHPFLDRWAYYFNDLFRNGQLLEQGINSFYDHIYKSLLLNVPYDEMVRELLTASAVSTWTSGPANFVARSHVFQGDGYIVNPEDTADELAIVTGKLFLGVNLECVSCHDGARHLEKINLWLARQKRGGMMRQAAFFGKTFIEPVYGRSPQFMVKDTRSGYNPASASALRPRRNPKEDVTPTFILTGATVKEGEKERDAFARLLTTDAQFARAAVNLIWTELMGQGIVDGPYDFDLDRQDPKNPPPAPWTIQPSHPELLDELAADFRAHHHDLRRLIRLIVSSRTYQLSAVHPGPYPPQYDTYFARRIVRRLSAEQTWDAIAQLAGNLPAYKITFADQKAASILQTHSPQDIEKADKVLYRSLQAFGQCDRYATEADRRPNMIQSAILLNDKSIRERVQIVKDGRLDKLLHAQPALSDAAFVDELFWAALARPASEKEQAVAREALRTNREQGAEDLLWALVNRLDFLFY